MPRLAFFVPGLPVQQGSKNYGVRNNGTAFGYESAKGLAPWRKAVKEVAWEAFMASDDWELAADCPIRVSLVFVFPPVSSGRHWKTSAPDIDKLARSVLDALTKASIYKDDARVVHLEANKVHGILSGVNVTVSTIDNHPFEGAIAA